MTDGTMTITRALTELKTLDKRIQHIINGATFVSYSGQLRKPHPEATDAKSKYQQIGDLIERRRKLKSSLTVSNATTLVKICDQEMTVAEAIEMKSSIKHRKTLLGVLKSQYAAALAAVESANEVQRAALQKSLGSSKDDKGSTMSAKELSDYSTKFMEVNGLNLYDPLSIKDRIADQETFITEFENQVDHVLSEKNATTYIKV